jgi:hypothetical protein
LRLSWTVVVDDAPVLCEAWSEPRISIIILYSLRLLNFVPVLRSSVLIISEPYLESLFQYHIEYVLVFVLWGQLILTYVCLVTFLMIFKLIFSLFSKWYIWRIPQMFKLVNSSVLKLAHFSCISPYTKETRLFLQHFA